MSDAAPGSAPTGGLRRALARAGASLLGLVRTRLELATVEFQEERGRTLSGLVLVSVAVLAFAFALLMLSALVVVVFWDTYRIAALAGVTIFYVIIGVWAVTRLTEQRRNAPSPFSATLAELERDAQWLNDEFHDRNHS